MQFAVCLHYCEQDEFSFNIHFENSVTLQDMCCHLRYIRPLLGLGLRLFVQYFPNAVVEAYDRFIVSV